MEPPHEEVVTPGGATYEIRLAVSPNGSFTFLNPRGESSGNLRAKPGDTIVFATDRAPFAIRFLGRPPGTRVDYWGSRNRLTIPANAAPGKYKYMIAIYDHDRIWIDDGCPEIIIEW